MRQVAEFTLRAAVGGLVVASVPIVARRLSPEAAGILVLVPAVTLFSFYFLGIEQGPAAVERASRASLLAIPTILAFLIAVNFSLARVPNVLLALTLGLLAWLSTAIVLTLTTLKRGLNGDDS